MTREKISDAISRNILIGSFKTGYSRRVPHTVPKAARHGLIEWRY